MCLLTIGPVMEDCELTTVDKQAIVRDVQERADRISSHASKNRN